MSTNNRRDQFAMAIAAAYMSNPDVSCWPMSSTMAEEITASADILIAVLEKTRES